MQCFYFSGENKTNMHRMSYEIGNVSYFSNSTYELKALIFAFKTDISHIKMDGKIHAINIKFKIFFT